MSDELFTSPQVEYREPSLTYKMTNVNVSSKIDELEAVKQSVNHILSVERYSNPIYDNDYGVELEQYIGKDYGFIVASIGETLKSALLQDDRITDVVVEDVLKLDIDACQIVFTVHTIYGEYQEVLNV